MVIDELVLILGLDSRRFNEGQRDALASFKKTKEGAEEFGKRVEESGAKLTEMFGVVRKGALGLLGAFVGGEAASFINHVINMDAATGRMAKTIGTSVENLSTWQYMIRQVGGEASSATSALSTMQQELDSIRQGRSKASPGLINLAGSAGFNIMGTGNADELYRRVQAFISGQINSGAMTANQAVPFLNSLPGMNGDMINLMLSDFQKLEAAAKAAGVATKETADAAADLQSKFSLLVQSMERFGASLIPIIDLLMKPLKDFGAKGTLDTIDRITGPIFEPGSRLEGFSNWLGGKMFGTGGTPGRASAADREAWINLFATSFGINPKVAMKVAGSEGFNAYSGDQGTSFGDFQLHLTPGGRGGAVGDEFRKQTGLDPRDPKNERAMDEFALKWASTHGWGDFHGAARSGIGNFTGITGAKGAADGRSISNKTSSSTSNNEVHIGRIEVNAPNATDANGVARGIGGALRRQSLIAPVNTALA